MTREHMKPAAAILSRQRAARQTAALVRIFGDCRKVQYPVARSVGVDFRRGLSKRNSKKGKESSKFVVKNMKSPKNAFKNILWG